MQRYQLECKCAYALGRFREAVVPKPTQNRRIAQKAMHNAGAHLKFVCICASTEIMYVSQLIAKPMYWASCRNALISKSHLTNMSNLSITHTRFVSFFARFCCSTNPANIRVWVNRINRQFDESNSVTDVYASKQYERLILCTFFTCGSRTYRQTSMAGRMTLCFVILSSLTASFHPPHAHQIQQSWQCF